MHSFLPVLASLATLSGLATADNIYTYLQGGCTGSSFFFKDIDHNICGVTITSNSSSIADAIAKGVTSVNSAKFEVQEIGKKRFIGWDEGPESNADGLLQCGTIVVNRHVKQSETCIDPPAGVKNFHGLSWTEPGDDSEEDAWSCTGSTRPDAVKLRNGRLFRSKDISEEDFDELVELAKNGGDSVSDVLAKLEVDSVDQV